MEFTNCFDRWAAYALGLAVAFLPMLNQADDCFSGMSVGMSWFAVSAVALVSVVRTWSECRCRIADLLLLLFWSWGVVRYFTSEVPSDVFTLFGMLSMVMVYVWARSIGNVYVVFPVLLAGGVLQTVWGVLQLFEILPAGHVYFKCTGSFDNPALWGIYLGVALFGGVVSLRRHSGKGSRLLVGVGMAIVLVGLVLARSRAAWVALMCGLMWTYGVPYFQTKWRENSKKVFMMGVLLLGVLAFAVWGIYRISPESVQGRLLIYRVAFDMFLDAPCIGHGISAFSTDYMLYQAAWFGEHADSAWVMVADNNHHAFNEYLKILCEQGVVGLVLFGGLIYGIVRCAGIGRVRIFSGLCIVLFVAGLFSYPFEDLSLFALFFMGLARAVTEMEKSCYAFSVSRIWKWMIVVLLVAGIGITVLSYGYRSMVESDLKNVRKGEKSVLDFLASETYGRLNASRDYVLWIAEELYREQHYREAIPLLERARELYCNELVLIALGICYRSEGMYAQAEDAFELASRMVPAYILPRYHLFALYRELGNVREACRVAEKALGMQVKMINTTVLRARNDMRVYVEENKEGGEWQRVE